MAIMQSCCFWKSVRRGSYASAIYTLFYFGISCLIASTNLYDEQKFLTGETDRPIGETFLEGQAISPTTVIFNILLLFCASLGFLASVLLIIGLRKDKRFLLIPWIFILFSDLFLEVAHFIYLLVIETLEFKPVLATIFTIDFFIMCLNIYCLLCVISQYQEYKDGRGYQTKQSRLPMPEEKIPLRDGIICEDFQELHDVKQKFIAPSPSAGSYLQTFNQTKDSTSPMIFGHTNFSVIPEEPTQHNENPDEDDAAISTGKSLLKTEQIETPASSNDVIKKKHVKFQQNVHHHPKRNNNEIFTDYNEINEKS